MALISEGWPERAKVFVVGQTLLAVAFGLITASRYLVRRLALFIVSFITGSV